MQWIASGRIPPQAEIDGLPWYQVLSPSQHVTLSGVMGTTRSASWHYEVQVARARHRPIGVEGGIERHRAGVRTGILAQIPMSEVAALFPSSVQLGGTPAAANGQPDPDRFMFTIRVVVQDAPAWSAWPGGPSSSTRTRA